MQLLQTFLYYDKNIQIFNKNGPDYTKTNRYGMHCSLNPRRLEDIEKLIEDDEENDD